MAITLNIEADSTPLLTLKKRLEEINKELLRTADIDAIKKLTDEAKALNSTFDTLNKSIEEEAKALEKATKEMELMDKIANKSLNTIGQLNDAQRLLTERLEDVEIGSEAYNQLSQQLIATNTQIRNIELSQEALDNEQLATELKNVAGGLSDVAGGFALLGASKGTTEEIAQTFAKVEGITKAVTGGIEAYAAGVKVLNAIQARGATIGSVFATITGTQTVATAAQTTATVAQTTATEGATVASNALNASLLLNPIFLLVAAIGAVVGALIYFTSETETAEKENDKFNSTLERQGQIFDLLKEKQERTAQNRIKLLQAQGASEKDILDAEIDALEVSEELRQQEIVKIGTNLNQRYKLRKKAYEEDNEELYKKINDEIKAEENKYRTLKNQDGQYYVDKQILQTQFATDEKEKAEKEKEDADKKAEEARKKQQEDYKKRLEAQKKYNQDRLEATRRLRDLEIASMDEGQEKEIESAKEQTKRQIEDLKAKYGDVKKLNEVQLKELNALEEAIRNDGNNNVLKIIDKYDKVEIAKQKEKNDKLLADQKKAQDDKEKLYTDYYNVFGELTLTEDQKERNALLNKYNDQRVLLQKALDDKLIDQEQYNKDLDNLNKAQAKEEVALVTKKEQEKSAQIKSAFDNISNILAGIEAQNASLANSFATDLTSAVGTFTTLATTQFENTTEKVAAYASAIGGLVSSLISSTNEDNQRRREQELESIDEDYNREQELLKSKYDKGLISQSEYDKQSKALLDNANKQKDIAGKKAFEQEKKLKIAAAIISGTQGAIAAFAGAQSLGPIAGPIVGGVLAAAVAGFTAANVNKIKSTQYESSSDSSISAPTVGASNVAPVNPQTNLFGQGNNNNNFGSTQNVNGNNNSNITVNAVVSVEEVTSAQANLVKIADNATL